MADRLYETHMHTPLCKHAEGEPEDYADVAHRRGLAGIVVTCHNPMPNGFSRSVRMDPGQLVDYVRLVTRARERAPVDVRLGMECDFFPGYEGWVRDQIASQPFEYILGSVHPQLPEYLAAHFRGDALGLQRQYFTHLAEAAELGIFDCLSHPDLVKNIFPAEWDPSRVVDHVRSCLDRIARAGTAMELNTSGLQKSISEFNPGPEILREIAAREIPIVLGADAHVPWRVSADFELALDAVEAAGFERVSYFLERTRIDVPIGTARASLVPPGLRGEDA